MFIGFSITTRRIFTVFLICSFSFSAFGQNSIVRTFYFRSNSYKLDKKDFKTLNEIGQQCKSDTLIFMKIFAFADTSGTSNYNDELSRKRAYQVYNYLLGKYMMDTARIYVTWVGEDSGIYDLHFPGAHVQKRCVDIVVNFKKLPKLK